MTDEHPAIARPPVIAVEGRIYDLRLKADRDRFTQVETCRLIAAQIRALRLMRGWSQAELAQRAGLAQARISRLENPITLDCSIATLRRVAHAFDVALSIRFAPWGSVTGPTPADFGVARHADDSGLERRP